MRRSRRSRKLRGIGAGFIVLALFVSGAGCGESVGHSPDVPVRYLDPEVGAARLMADATIRVDGVVNVTRAYPDPGGQVVGAAVLIDDSIAKDDPRTDFRHRPVFVVYSSKDAATEAVAGHLSGSHVRNGDRVIYFPVGFPKRARTAYERGLGAGLQ